MQSKIKINLRDTILGGQDGLVNVLGVVLGVSAATTDLKIIIISGLAATFAESISMAAVAYTSTEASMSEYLSKLQNEKNAIQTDPNKQTKDVEAVFSKWGFDGELLQKATTKITSNKELWAKFMMAEELKLSKKQIENPLTSAVVVGLASLGGSLIPLLPYFLIKQMPWSTYTAIVMSTCALFVIGFIKAKETIGTPWKSGLKIAIIGMVSAFAGYIIGKLMGGMAI